MAKKKKRTQKQLDPKAMSPADVARLLARAGSRHATAEVIREHIQAGAPANADGTLNLVHYAAWLAAQAQK